MGLVSIPDAQSAGPGTDWKEQRVAPKHAAVWVRVKGRWRKGKIAWWARELGSEQWVCVLVADKSAEGSRWLGRFVYDARSIRPRYGDAPPR